MTADQPTLPGLEEPTEPPPVRRNAAGVAVGREPDPVCAGCGAPGAWRCDDCRAYVGARGAALARTALREAAARRHRVDA